MSYIAVIADIVGSKGLTDRAAAQKVIENVLDAGVSHAAIPDEDVVASFRPTVGDEFQGIFGNLHSAILAILFVKLSLPEGLELRFGIGAGEVKRITGTNLEDGSAWWNARAAIEYAKKREKSGEAWLRSWFHDDSNPSLTDSTNSYFHLEGHVLSRMKIRERRMAHQALAGSSQTEIAKQEKLSQSAVSQALSRSGASALLASTRNRGSEK